MFKETSESERQLILRHIYLHTVFVEPHSYAIYVDERLTDTREYVDSLNHHVDQRTFITLYNVCAACGKDFDDIEQFPGSGR